MSSVESYKKLFLTFAEVLDAYRAWPRGLISLYGYMVYETSMWFMGLQDPNAAQSAFVSIIWGASAAWFGIYVSSGRKWNESVKSDSTE